MGEAPPNSPNDRKSPTGEWMFDLNKKIPCSSVTEEHKLQSGEWMLDLNTQFAFSSIRKEGKSPNINLNKSIPSPASLASLELLNKFRNRMKRASQDLQNDRRKDEICNSTCSRELSTVEIMKVAIAKFKQAISLNSGDISMLVQPLDGVHSGLSSEIAEDVELILFLLACAKKVADKQFHGARKLLSMCNNFANRSGNPVQRVVYYFAEALGDRIDFETGLASSNGLEGAKRWQSSMIEGLTTSLPAILAQQKELPFFMAVEPAAMQVILDCMASAKRIHLIDLHIRSGIHWTILMQGLAVRRDCPPLEMLTITAVGTVSVHLIEATGRSLSSFAESMGLPFSFKIVMMSDEKDLSEDLFELDSGDAVGIYSAVLLRNTKPSLFRVIKNLRPIVMVVTEIETDTNLPDFMDQFTESLVFYSASFDSFESCMDRHDPYRMIFEGEYYRGGIQNVIRFNREDRINCHMKIRGWRELFKRFGMVEREMSMSSLYQARLMVEKYPCWSYCTLEMDGKCLLLGWKGRPLISLSAWEFLRLED